MTDTLKQIAMRMKTLREISGISVESLAEEFKIEKDVYEKYENGESDIPVSFLLELAHKFKVELTALLTGEEPRLRHYSLVRGGKGAQVERRKEYKYQDLGYNFINKKMETFLVTVPPLSEGESYHCYNHPGQEFTYLLEGRLKVILDSHEVILSPGDALYFDSGSNHVMIAMDNMPAKFLSVIA